MPRINCNIIKDLLPSYIDELCSTESKQLIEEHFEECTDCKKLYEKVSLEQLYCKHAKANAAKEIDYFKTIQINVNKKNKTLLIVTGILFFLQLYFNIDPNPFGYSVFISYVNYIFPVLIAVTLFAVLPDFSEHPVPNKVKFSVLGIEFAAMTYVFAITTYTGGHLLQEKLPFGMQAAEIGPFLAIQLLAFTICFILAFIATLVISLRKKAISPALCFVPLGGLSLMFEYDHLLHEFTTRFCLELFIHPCVILVCEVIVLVGIYMLMNRKKVV
ncbi:MAG: zf-HC2 domain-containing protein [Agathobacter sp.]|nr:zf-HC2 domain-containing protein [Agathobacter sp.]